MHNPSLPTVFMHIPKAAGVALTDALEHALAPSKTVRGFDRVLFGAFSEFDTFSPDERSRVYLDPAAIPGGDLVSAHMAFSTLSRRFPSANYLTMLREPVSRILSNWLYWRGTPDEYLVNVGAWAEYVRQARKPLKHFLCRSDLACHIDNLAVRMLLWQHTLIPENDFIDPRHDEVLLNEAIGRLERFDFVDFMENSRLQANFEAWLGKPLTLSRSNETNPVPAALRSPLHNQLDDPRTVALLESRSRLDLRLWLSVARHRMGVDTQFLRQSVVLSSAARFALLMQP